MPVLAELCGVLCPFNCECGQCLLWGNEEPFAAGRPSVRNGSAAEIPPLSGSVSLTPAS